ncbi:hypothetical protein GCM10008018_48810 [Paenibacillus marchantiophytorum]|uniref:SLH domain-containing protein n=1 Tax=Paenibacillus marchantiophytorum TaxID=1619310 RepID=A0ABQ1F1N3_9BACL|nr:hypothetical protein GCM10008018_48810 [Paenibacillus marchantiophytorum]
MAISLAVCLGITGASLPVYAADTAALTAAPTGILKVENAAVHIFAPIKDDGDNGDHVHGSSITELPSGELLSVWFQGNGERDATTTRIMGARSQDGGKTWNTPFIMADAKDIADINPAVYVDAGERLWLFWYPVLAGRWETSQPKYAYAEKGSYEFANVGNNKPNWTWSEVINVKIGMNIGNAVDPNSPDDYISPRLQKGYVHTLKAKLAEFKEYSFKPVDQGGAGVNARINEEDWEGFVEDRLKLAGGNPLDDAFTPTVADKIWAGRSGYPLARRLGWQTKNKPLTIPIGGGKVRMLLPLYSDTMEQSMMAITEYNPSQPLGDNSIRWEFSEPIVGAGIIQASMAQRSDGTIVAYMRDNGPLPNRVVYSESKDGGFTWTIGKDIPELLDPGVGHDLLRLKNGNWVFVHVDAERKRNSLAVALSDDEGKTWKYRRHIAIDSRANQGDYHYPAVSEADNGDVLITFTRDFTADDKQASGSSLGGFNNIMLARVTEDWIQQGDSDNEASRIVYDYGKIELDIAVPTTFSIGSASDKALKALLPTTVKGYLTYGKGAVNAKMAYTELPVNWDLNALRSNFKLDTYIDNKFYGDIDMAKLPEGELKDQLPAFKPLLRAYFYQDASAYLIVEVKDENIITNVGKAPVLPSVVTAVYSDNREAAAGVNWQPIDPSSYAAAGKFTVTGVVHGTTMKATAHVTVIDSQQPRSIVRLKDEKMTTTVGRAPVLPSVVTAVYSDSLEEPVKVTWDQIDPLQYSAPGDFEVQGAVQETNLKAVAQVSVLPILVDKVTLDRSSLSLFQGGTAELKATVTPANATNPNVVWSSSRAGVASVDAYGKVTAITEGDTIITVKTVDGNFEATATVQVRRNEESGGHSDSGTSTNPPTNPPIKPDPKPDPKPESKPEEPKKPDPKPTFTDIAGTWAQEAIQALTAKGIINGTSEKTFEPDKNISRADFLMLLVRALGIKAEFHANFEDVSQSDYYYEVLGMSKALGITNGIDGIRFNPKEEISRQDLMVLAARALKLSGKINAIGTATDLNGFADASSIADYAVESVAALVKEGIIEGSGQTVNPLGKATRAEVAAMVYRILIKIK